MAMDPVLLLVQDIQAAQLELKAVKGKSSHAAYAAAIEHQLIDLRHQLLHMMPTSAVGAAELIRYAADMLLPAFARHAGHLRRIADRFSAGQRLLADICWLRQMAKAVEAGLCGDPGGADRLLDHAVQGATIPVVVYRNVKAPLRVVEDDGAFNQHTFI
jgi:hypothetical protein